jgi:hypothetical protein
MSFKLDILAATVERAERLDDASSHVSGTLEEKAQQTGGIAGLFLAAAFGFLKPDDLSTFLLANGRSFGYLLIGTIIAFLACLATCLSVTWLRKTPGPLGLATLSSLNDDLLRLSDDELSEDVQRNYFRDQLRMWESIISSRKQLNRQKARRLLCAQSLLASGMFLIAVLLIISVSNSINCLR